MPHPCRVLARVGCLEPYPLVFRIVRKCRVAYSSLRLARVFSLLVFAERPYSTRLFLRKSRTSLPSPVQSRSENALEWGTSQVGSRRTFASVGRSAAPRISSGAFSVVPAGLDLSRTSPRTTSWATISRPCGTVRLRFEAPSDPSQVLEDVARQILVLDDGGDHCPHILRIDQHHPFAAFRRLHLGDG